MLKWIVFLLTVFFSFNGAIAQSYCSEHIIYGTWRNCGWVKSTYSLPAIVNTDSLKQAFPHYNDSSGRWQLASDGTYNYHAKGTNIRKGRFRFDKNNCVIRVPSGKLARQHIVYLDDNCMIVWHNNPKYGYLTVYRRETS